MKPVALEVNKFFFFFPHIKDLRQLTLQSSVIKLLFWQLLNEINFDGNVRADRAKRRKDGFIPLESYGFENSLFCGQKGVVN